MKNNGGATAAIVQYISGTSDTLGFFKPYQSGIDFYDRTMSILTAPISAAGTAVCFAAVSINNILEGMTHLLLLEPMIALPMFGEALSALALIALLTFIVILSPVINTIDLIGSLITTLMIETTDPVHENGVAQEKCALNNI